MMGSRPHSAHSCFSSFRVLSLFLYFLPTLAPALRVQEAQSSLNSYRNAKVVWEEKGLKPQ